MTRVALAFAPPQAVIDRFDAAFDMLHLPLGSDTLAAHARALDGCEALVLATPTKLDQAFLDVRPPSLKVVATYSVGHEHLDLPAAKAAGLVVLHTPDVLTDAVADNAILLMLGATRRATESIDLIRSRQWTGWTPTQLIGVGVTGKALGVFGMGRIARGVAARAKAFGMRVHYYDPRKSAGLPGDDAELYTDLTEFLRATDVLLLAAPLNDSTRYFLDAAKLRQMKPTAVVVNVGRGDLIREDDLIAALGDGTIFAAGLDVFRNEPDLDPRLYDLPNVFMLPHIGSSTIETRIQMGDALIDGIKAVFAGKEPTNRLG